MKKLTAAIITLVTINAYATGQGGYFGVMVGQTNLHGQNQTITVPTVHPVNIFVKPQGSGLGSRLFAGYNMNQYAALETGFTFYSSMNYQTSPLSNTLKTRAASFDLLVKGMFPIANSGFGIFGKLGGAYFAAKTTGKVQGVNIPKQSASAFRSLVGVGASYDLTQNWVVDLSYTTVMYNTSNIKNPSFLALGISYHLLDPVCGQFLC